MEFIDRSVAGNESAERANLNYWAYWFGAIRDAQPGDRFMRREAVGWDPVRLLHGLASGLHQAPAYRELYVHSLWALLTTNRWLPQAAPALADSLAAHAVQLLDSGGISRRARRELSAVHYVLGENRA